MQEAKNSRLQPLVIWIKWKYKINRTC